jgi:protocatechuate 3,4-dioxygenase beta subunit
MGYLKGTWQSLRGLRVRLDHEDHIQYACIWIIACVHLHSFIIAHQKDINIATDEFFQNGLRIIEEDRRRDDELRTVRETLAMEVERAQQVARDIDLMSGKVKREELKLELFRHLFSQ